MSKISAWARWLWVELQLTAPPVVHRTAIPFLHKAKELVRLAAQPSMPLYELSGRNDAGPLTVTYGGLGYARPSLESMLFLERPAERQLTRIFTWHPRKALATPSSDLTIIETGHYLVRKLPRRSSITLPFRVEFVLDLSGTWEEVIQRFRRDAQRNDVRKVEKFGYAYEISNCEPDLDFFYHRMYLPNAQQRHNELAVTSSIREARQFMQHGSLFLVKRDGVSVAGGLCYERDGILIFQEMGVLDGDVQLLREGAVSALNYLRVRWAHREGYRAVNFGDCWPFMSGIYRSKRKWGAAVGTLAREHKQIWIRINRDTPAVSHFLEKNPCVTINPDGKLHGLIVTADPNNVTAETKARWHKLYSTPGLCGLMIQSVTDLMERPAS